MNFAKFFEKQWKSVVIALGAVLVLGAVTSFISFKATEKEKKAQEKYFAIEKKLLDLKSKKSMPPAKDQKNENVDFTQVKKDLESVIAEYPSSMAAKMAGLHYSNLLTEEKNFELALTVLQKVENKDSGLINTLVQQQIGQLYADKEKCQEAIEIWQKILQRKEALFIHNEIKIQQALCYTKLNDFKKAEEILTNLANQNVNPEIGSSTSAKEAEKYLRLIQFKKASGT